MKALEIAQVVCAYHAALFKDANVDRIEVCVRDSRNDAWAVEIGDRRDERTRTTIYRVARDVDKTSIISLDGGDWVSSVEVAQLPAKCAKVKED